MADDIFKPYLSDPMVKKIPPNVLSRLNDKQLNDVIRAVDQMTRGVREFVLSNPLRTYQRHAGHFSSAVSLARALAFLDAAHSTHSVNDIVERVWNVTPTTSQRSSFNTSLNGTVIPHLISDGIIQFDPTKKKIEKVMPYQVGSKLYVRNNFLLNTKLFSEQKNHFDIMYRIQDFPELTNDLEANSPNWADFARDYGALSDIDIIRPISVTGREFTFAKAYVLGEKALNTWQTVLEEANEVRVALKQLLITTGEFGGYITQSEIVEATGWNQRVVNRLIRHVDNMGLAQRTRTLQLEDALSRPTSGTLLGLNYYEYNNAADILRLIRSVPESTDILVKIQNRDSVTEDELIDEFEVAVVQKVRNSLDQVGLISKDAITEGVLTIAPNKGGKELLSDVLTVAANSRKITGPEYDIKDKLSSFFDKIDEDRVQKEAVQIKLDFYGIEAEETRK